MLRRTNHQQWPRGRRWAVAALLGVWFGRTGGS